MQYFKNEQLVKYNVYAIFGLHPKAKDPKIYLSCCWSVAKSLEVIRVVVVLRFLISFIMCYLDVVGPLYQNVKHDFSNDDE